MMVETVNSSGDANLREVLNLDVPAEAESIGGAADSVLSMLITLEVPEEKRMAIALAVQEALTNAARHGCQEDPSKSIHCQMRGEPRGRILIIISDPGPGFDPHSLPNPKLPDKIYGDHGRGIFLIRQLMDEVRFERGGTVIRMWKY